MSKQLESLIVHLTFHPETSNTERDDCHAYLFEKLDELMKEASGFACYRVLTDEDSAPAAAGGSNA